MEDENDNWDAEADNDDDVAEDGMIVCDGEGEREWENPDARRTRWTSDGEGIRVLRYRATGVMTCAEREQKWRLRAKDASNPEQKY